MPGHFWSTSLAGGFQWPEKADQAKRCRCQQLEGVQVCPETVRARRSGWGTNSGCHTARSQSLQIHLCTQKEQWTWVSCQKNGYSISSAAPTGW